MRTSWPSKSRSQEAMYARDQQAKAKKRAMAAKSRRRPTTLSCHCGGQGELRQYRQPHKRTGRVLWHLALQCQNCRRQIGDIRTTATHRMRRYPGWDRGLRQGH